MTDTEFMTLRENADIKIIDVKTDLSSYAASDLRKIL